ncbi:hypothetical protein ACFFU1_16905 [Algibacter miyuki]|uniref:Uncharacterized protein n=1 Tax=Algibacter miyuki TaxID=1306933 RepID=A0ABV5H3V4_9FLAO|nr:hypothetical protein [Algibacter miyuki]MDN3664199.1 hypothetical protein [Algibacter miyuki]MDN3664206.1 hypothetical protein [Algibacter miyuki]MDN3665659.1 hypothetical protein [Algibacter miyuki]MDN3667678.1 hypothetical protein [Algibacter miyuki]MDN3667682.1 hypothetical protein [Algibacter miyuki]
MKNIVPLLILLFLFSCGNEKVLQLPEINHSEISEINDVSVAYLFYDETQPDSLELNRKNIINTTNWLINVDKRLKLKQVIPKISFLQKKKVSAGHQKEGVKNYFTCHDTSTKSPGFIEFTDITYHQNSVSEYLETASTSEKIKHAIQVNINESQEITIINSVLNSPTINTSKNNLITDLNRVDIKNGQIYLSFHENLLFQEYITYKMLFDKVGFDKTTISQEEFIFN